MMKNSYNIILEDLGVMNLHLLSCFLLYSCQMEGPETVSNAIQWGSTFRSISHLVQSLCYDLIWWQGFSETVLPIILRNKRYHVLRLSKKKKKITFPLMDSAMV